MNSLHANVPQAAEPRAGASLPAIHAQRIVTAASYWPAPARGILSARHPCLTARPDSQQQAVRPGGRKARFPLFEYATAAPAPWRRSPPVSGKYPETIDVSYRLYD